MEKVYNILVVDDIKVNVELLRMRLEKEGYNVISAFNGREALKEVDENNIDLMLLDVIMPDINGFEVCERVKSDERTRNIPIVMITSLSGTNDKVKALEVGCDDFLSKPINDIELIARVRSLLRLKDYTDEINVKNILFQKEIELAGKVQNKILLKELPEVNGFDIDIKYIPCFTVGGDFYYFIKFNDNKLGVFVADVVGHGVQAALITMILKTLLDSILEKYKLPSDYIKQINQQLISILGGKFTYVTGMFMILDSKEKVITYSSAGHPAGFLCNENGITELKSKGYVMGLFEDAEFKVNSHDVKSGDQILMYTDGAFEAENKDFEIFGEERLKDILIKNYKSPSKDINEKIIEKLKSFVGEIDFNDDINLISLKIL